MSKSLGNYIGITEAPGEIYGATLSLPDEAMDSWFALLAVERPPSGTSPRDAKRALARALVERFHGAEAAATAAERVRRACTCSASCPRRSRSSRWRRSTATVHLPAVIAAGLRDVALGGAADALAGRRAGSTASRWRPPSSTAARAARRRRPAGRQAPLPPAAGELRAGRRWPSTRGLLRLETAGDGAIVDLTEGVRSIVERSGVQSGVACVFAVGATVAITTIEYEPGGGRRSAGAARSPDRARGRLPPQRAQPRHQRPQPSARGPDRAERDDPGRRRRAGPGHLAAGRAPGLRRPPARADRLGAGPVLMRYSPAARRGGAPPVETSWRDRGRRAIIGGRAGSLRALRSRLLRRSPLPDRARRSLKTQQHAHLVVHRPGVRPGSIRRSQPGSADLRLTRHRSRRHGVLGAASRSMTALRDGCGPSGPCPNVVLHGEFDPGSGRTLAACLTHASGATNQGLPWGKAANG